MAMDSKGNNHKAVGRPDGGQFDRKAGQDSDDDLDLDAVDARRRVFDRIVAGDDDGVDPETARRIRVRRSGSRRTRIRTGSSPTCDATASTRCLIGIWIRRAAWTRFR